jgi:RNA polymerase sigma-70 factor, ECF subfamily
MQMAIPAQVRSSTRDQTEPHNILTNNRLGGLGLEDVGWTKVQWARPPGPRYGARMQWPATTPRVADESDGTRFTRNALPWLNEIARYALFLTRDPADADDLVQETYYRAYRSWHTFQDGTCTRAWLYAICRHEFLRARGHAQRAAALEDTDTEAMGASNGVDRMLTRLDLNAALTAAFASLSARHRSTILVVDVDGWSYRAASAILGVPIGTVRSRLFRARRLMRRTLSAYALDAGLAPVTDP